MKSKFTWIFTLFMVLAVQLVSAQEKTVTGTVTDADFLDPIPGVSVLLEGTQYGTETDMDGKYSINARPGQRLVFKYAGFEDVVLTVGQSDVLNATMKEADATQLEDLVITKYATTAKPKSNDAVSTVTAKTIEGRPNASFVQTLQAQVPGLNITTGSGQPGSGDSTIIIRGVGSINGNTEPLFIIDGVPMGITSFRAINPNDIENISVLKDAGATAIYGNRGANGVIEVTTKRGSFEQDLTIKYVGTTGVSFLQNNKYDLMNAQELMRFENAYYQAQDPGSTPVHSQNKIDNTVSSDWLDYFFNPAISQNHSLSFASGAKNMASFTSLSYADHEGILKSTGMKRFTFRNNLSGRNNNGRLNYSTNLNANYTKSSEAGNLGTGSVNQNYVLGALKSLPYLNPADYDGTWEFVDDAYAQYDLGATPYMLMDKLRTFYIKRNEFRMIGNGSINYDLGSGFKVGTSAGFDYMTSNISQGEHPNSFNSMLFLAAGQEFGGRQWNTATDIFLFNSSTNLNWNKVFNDVHEINASAYLEYQKGHYVSTSMTQTGIVPEFWVEDGGTGWIDEQEVVYWPYISKSRQESGLFSYFGKFDYDYDGKYGVGATVRRDASFRFIDENRWGTFWSVSGRWNISNEDFMKDSAFNNLKLRASYGTAGNQDIMGTGNFGAGMLYTNLYNTTLGYDGAVSYGLAQIGNHNLMWETIEQANIGLDFEIFESRLRGSVDVYQKTTKDLYQSVPVSSIYGTSSINDNFGNLKNSGIEAILAADLIRKEDFVLTLNVNGSYNKNELVDLPREEIWSGGTALTGMREGGPIGEFYLARNAGINPETGNYWFLDKDGNYTEDPQDSDRVWTGKSYIPKYQGGFGLDIDYKGFFLNSLFSFAADVYRYDDDLAGFYDYSDIGFFNKSNDVWNYWSPDNTNTEIAGLNVNNVNGTSRSDHFLRDASYVRLRYVMVGYNFNAEQLNFLNLSGLRVYAQAENMFTWTKWKGFDAESNRGIDYSQYPTPKIVSFGVEVQF